jgi:pimeloyl-ACP methyl ester carboxylesterase
MVGANAAAAILLDQTLYSAVDAIAAGTVPTLNLWGVHEGLIPLAMGEWCRDNIPRSTYIVFDGSGHCPQLEEPTRCVETITTWLAETL